MRGNSHVNSAIFFFCGNVLHFVAASDPAKQGVVEAPRPNPGGISLKIGYFAP
jgi:hypothetical protein